RSHGSRRSISPAVLRVLRPNPESRAGRDIRTIGSGHAAIEPARPNAVAIAAMAAPTGVATALVASVLVIPSAARDLPRAHRDPSLRSERQHLPGRQHPSPP